MNWIIFALFLAVWIALAISKRTRPLTLVVVIAWLLYDAMAAFVVHDDRTRAIGEFVVALGLVANLWFNREKYTAQLRGGGKHNKTDNSDL